MPSHGTYLILLTVASIVFLLLLILVVKLHAFVSLLLSAMALGLAAGMPPDKVLKSIQGGFGDALGLHRGGGGAGRHDRAVPGTVRRRAWRWPTGCSSASARTARPGPCWWRPSWSACRSSSKSASSSWCRWSGAWRARPSARCCSTALPDGGGAHHHAFAGAAASGAGRRVATARRRPGPHHSLRHRHLHPHGDRRRASSTAGGSRGASTFRCRTSRHFAGAQRRTDNPRRRCPWSCCCCCCPCC